MQREEGTPHAAASRWGSCCERCRTYMNREVERHQTSEGEAPRQIGGSRICCVSLEAVLAGQQARAVGPRVQLAFLITPHVQLHSFRRCGAAASDKLHAGLQALRPDSPRWLLLSGAPQEKVASALAQCQGSACKTETLQQQVEAMVRTGGEVPSGPGAETRGAVCWMHDAPHFQPACVVPLCARPGPLRAIGGIPMCALPWTFAV